MAGFFLDRDTMELSKRDEQHVKKVRNVIKDMNTMSEQRIFMIARTKSFEVRRDLFSHKKLRERCHQMALEKKLILVGETLTSYLYRAIPGAIDCK
jgi:hypothetical protein